MANLRFPRIVLGLPLIVLMTSSFCYADSYRCFDLYMWSPIISFSKGNIVRNGGAAYIAINETKGEAPVNGSTSWHFMGMCSTQTKEKNISCDFNGDGKADLAKGFPRADLIAGKSNDMIPSNIFEMRDAGEVAIFYDKSQVNKPADQVWDQNSMKTYSAKRGASFGEALTTGDFNNDLFCDLAIGAPGTNNVSILYGSSMGLTPVVTGDNGIPINPDSAHIFSQSSPNIPGTPEAGDNFGHALAAGDLNGDGFDDLVIGAYGEDLEVEKISIIDAGYVFVLFGSKRGLQTTQLKPLAYSQNMGVASLGDVEKGDGFGLSVDVADFDHDGFADVVLTAPYETEPVNGKEKEKGKVSLFRGYPNGIDLSSRIDITPKNFAESTKWILFGAWTKTTDFNGDGYIDLEIDLTNYDYDPNKHPYLTMQVPGSATGLLFTNVVYRNR